MWKRAWKDSLSFFGWNLRTLTVGLLLWILGALFFWQWQGVEAMLEEIAVAVSFGLIPIGFFLVGLYVFHLIRAPIYMKWEKEKEPNMTVSPYSGRRQSDWEKTEHLMWAELRVTNTSPSQELKDVGVNIVTCLQIIEKSDSPNDYYLHELVDWNPTSVYWSERNAPSHQMSLSIPPSATRIALVAFQNNSNGGQFNFNTSLCEWVVRGAKIEVEISSPNSALLKRAFYIDCHGNIWGGERAHFEFVEWGEWATSRNITLLTSDKESSQSQ